MLHISKIAETTTVRFFVEAPIREQDVENFKEFFKAAADKKSYADETYEVKSDYNSNFIECITEIAYTFEDGCDVYCNLIHSAEEFIDATIVDYFEQQA